MFLVLSRLLSCLVLLAFEAIPMPEVKHKRNTLGVFLHIFCASARSRSSHAENPEFRAKRHVNPATPILDKRCGVYKPQLAVKFVEVRAKR